MIHSIGKFLIKLNQIDNLFLMQTIEQIWFAQPFVLRQGLLIYYI
jgi:hypothetical protein